MEEKSIKIAVIETSSPRGMRPSLEGLAEASIAKVVDLPVDQLSKRLSGEIEKLHEMFSQAKLSTNGSRVKSATFSLGVDTKGEISICSVATGGITGRVTFSVTLEFDKE